MDVALRIDYASIKLVEASFPVRNSGTVLPVCLRVTVSNFCTLSRPRPGAFLVVRTASRYFRAFAPPLLKGEEGMKRKKKWKPNWNVILGLARVVIALLWWLWP